MSDEFLKEPTVQVGVLYFLLRLVERLMGMFSSMLDGVNKTNVADKEFDNRMLDLYSREVTANERHAESEARIASAVEGLKLNNEKMVEILDRLSKGLINTDLKLTEIQAALGDVNNAHASVADELNKLIGQVNATKTVADQTLLTVEAMKRALEKANEAKVEVSVVSAAS